ncbi:hypothetical protein G6F55_014148 [Rhizopus delemar]|nr:hypothetical protein G6F55_014148 [Rhizopus delemar]
MRGRLQRGVFSDVEAACHQRNDRAIVDGAQGAAAARTEQPRGIVGRSVARWRAARAGPRNVVLRKFHPAKAGCARMPLAEFAGAGVRILRRSGCGEADVAAQATARVGSCGHRLS